MRGVQGVGEIQGFIVPVADDEPAGLGRVVDDAERYRLPGGGQAPREIISVTQAYPESRRCARGAPAIDADRDEVRYGSTMVLMLV